MGIKLGPIISDIFMNDFETKHMPELIKLGVLHWLRFVDDILVIIKVENKQKKSLNFSIANTKLSNSQWKRK